jgi:flagellar biosynthesis protein FliR
MSDAHLLIFARCAGFVFRAPGFSHPAVPAPLRAASALALAVIFSGVPAAPLRQSDAREFAPMDGGEFALALASEVVLGAALGLAVSMLYDGAYAGGRTLDDFVGIRAGVPSADVAAGAGFGRLWSLAFAAGFFVLGGDRVALRAFGETFASVPPGSLVTGVSLESFGVALPATLARAAIFVAGPALALALCGQLGLAIVARVVPRFSTFTLAFPVVFALALAATLGTLPVALGAAGRPPLDVSVLRAR